MTMSPFFKITPNTNTEQDIQSQTSNTHFTIQSKTYNHKYQTHILKVSPFVTDLKKYPWLGHADIVEPSRKNRKLMKITPLKKKTTNKKKRRATTRRMRTSKGAGGGEEGGAGMRRSSNNSNKKKGKELN